MMRRRRVIGLLLAALGFIPALLSATPALAQETCFCRTDLAEAVKTDIIVDDKQLVNECLDVEATETCDQVKQDVYGSLSKKFVLCDQNKYAVDVCNGKKEAWVKEKAEKLKTVGTKAKELLERDQDLGFFGRAIPPCVFKDELTERCRDISVFVLLIINFAKSSLGIIGVFALAYFIYGGLLILLSQGSPEKIKKGTDTIVAALVGLVIIFAAYVFIRFMGEAIGVKSEFNLL